MVLDHLTALRLDRRDDVVRDLNEARDAGDRDRVEELLVELARIDFEYQEATAEPAVLTEEEEQELHEASGINDGIDARPVPRHEVRDVFNPSGWLRPYAERRRPRTSRAPLVETLHRRVRARLPRPRRVRGCRSSSKDPPPSDPDLARELYGAELSGHRPQPCPWRERFSAGSDPL
jgi:hypothetical protein